MLILLSLYVCRGDRYDALRACIGESLCLKLHTFHVFMVSKRYRINVKMLFNFKVQFNTFKPNLLKKLLLVLMLVCIDLLVI